jgi:hypothetical protein
MPIQDETKKGDRNGSVHRPDFMLITIWAFIKHRRVWRDAIYRKGRCDDELLIYSCLSPLITIKMFIVEEHERLVPVSPERKFSVSLDYRVSASPAGI